MAKLKSILSIPFLLIIIPFYTSFGQQQLSDRAVVSLLTCDSGAELYSLYGHTALRINDSENGIDLVYNYGYFDFNTPNFYMKFVKGNLQYFAASDSYEDFLAGYVYEQRGVYEQRLNLSAGQKQHIYDDLNAVLASSERFYTYKFIDKNCTTMVADVINRNISEPLSTDINVSGQSYRKILYTYQRPYFYENLGINIMFGSKTDRQFDHLFLPLQLLEGVRISRNNGKALSDSVQTLNINSGVKNTASLWNNCYTYCGIFLLFALIRNRTIQLSFLVMSALLGIFVMVSGFVSLHQELVQNLNVLMFNPLLLLLVYFVLRKKQKYVLWISYVCGGMLVVYSILLVPKVHFLLFVPMILTHGILLFSIMKNQRARVASGQ